MYFKKQTDIMFFNFIGELDIILLIFFQESKTHICILGTPNPNLMNLGRKQNRKCQSLSFPASLAGGAWSCDQAPPIRCPPHLLTWELVTHITLNGRLMVAVVSDGAARLPFSCPLPRLVPEAAPIPSHELFPSR